jgi:probable phosphoglycerate mutase
LLTRIIALRHGETEWNSIGKQQGQLNSDLTEAGIRQAEAVAESLKNYSIDHYYSSDLGRAIQTASIISSIIKKEFTTNTGLRERHLGIMQGFTMQEFGQLYPEVALRFREHDPDYRIPEGESIRDRFERGVRCIESLVKKHPGTTILIITHGGILTGMFQKAIDIPLHQRRTFSILNMSLNIFTISEQMQWFLETWGDICALNLKGLSAVDDF